MKQFTLACFICACALTASAQTNSKTPLVKELVEAVGMKALMENMIDITFEQMKKQYPKVDSAAWTEMKKMIVSDELIDKIAPVYERNFTEEDLKGMIAFYNSPLGKKVISRLPAVMREAGQIGEQWGQEIGERITARMKEKGFIKE